MRKLFLLPAGLFMLGGCSTMPVNNEPLVVDNVLSMPSLSKDQIYNGIDQWMSAKSKHYKISYKDKDAGTIISKNSLKYPCRSKSECFLYDGNLSYTLRISAKDGRVRATYDDIVFDRHSDSLNKVAFKHQTLSKGKSNAVYITEFLNSQSQAIVNQVTNGQDW